MQNDDTPQRLVPKLKEDRVLRRIRKQIIDGDYGPGTRLPTRSELEEEHEVSRQTMQNVFDSLLNEGFVESRGRHGTFVTDHPPHLSNYGLVFTRHPSDEDGWPNFWTAMFNEAQSLHRDGRRHFHAFYGGSISDTGSGSLHDLTDMVTSGRLAGLIFPAKPVHLKGSPILEQPGMPRVMLSGAEMVPGATQLALSQYDMIIKALDHLQACGRKRLALIIANAPGSALNDFWTMFKECCEERGMTTAYELVHGVDPLRTYYARRVTALMAKLPASERPDGLVIVDDNLVGDAVYGLTRGKDAPKVGQDIDVVAHANFPWVTPSPVPITRVGFNIREVIRACIENIDLQRRGEQPPTTTYIKPQLESELE